jgi:hypothetical protein
MLISPLKWLFGVIIILHSFSLKAQVYSILNDTICFYLRVPYRFDERVQIDSLSSVRDSSYLSTEEGHLYFRAESVGVYNFNVNIDRQRTESVSLYVDSLPLPAVYLYSRSSGISLKKAAILEGNLELKSTIYLGDGLNLKVISFEIYHLRDGEVVSHWLNNDSKLTQESKERLAEIIPGDLVLYTRVQGFNYYRQLSELDSFLIAVAP